MTEYYKYIGSDKYDYTINKIYKIVNPFNLEAPFNFIDNEGEASGWSGSNYQYFVPATLEEWLIQEGIKSDYSYLTEFFNQNNIK
jgi:hypothetical protein